MPCLRYLPIILLVSLVTACGGGGNAGQTSVGGGTAGTSGGGFTGVAVAEPKPLRTYLASIAFAGVQMSFMRGSKDN